MLTSITKSLTANQRGILATVTGMGAFVLNDALVKLASESLGSAQLIFLRGVFTLFLLACLAWGYFGIRPNRQLMTDAFAPKLLLRALIDALATAFYLTALFHLPIGNATAINMALPIFIAVGAAWIYGEKIHGLRWLLIAAGFLGVLLIIQPRAQGFNHFAWLCLIGTCCHAARDLLTRSIPKHIPSIVVTLMTALAVTVFAGPLSLWQGWNPLTWPLLISLFLAAAFLAVGYLMIVVSMRQGEMSVIAPFRYSALLMALVLGYLVWGEVPNTLAVGGIILLVFAGLAMLRGKTG